MGKIHKILRSLTTSYPRPLILKRTMKGLLLCSLLLLFSSIGHAQATTQTLSVHGQAYRYEAFNEVAQPRGLLVLFNGGAGIAAGIPKESSIADTATRYHLQTIGIDQSAFYLTDSTYTRIRTIISQVMKENDIPDNLFVGGFSLGGFTAVRLAEMAVEQQDTFMVPNAVFAIDPPLDHLALRNYCLRELNRVCANEEANRLGKGEAHWILNYYQEHFGPLEQDSSTYINQSCFTTRYANGGNAKSLDDVPVRLIHEIDIMWLIEERCRDLRDANVMVGSQFIRYLRDIGNQDAMITLTTNKGYRSDGRRHPHSWSIADPVETLDWLMRYVE